MDAANPAARREIALMSDLLAAVRLPSSAHQRAAGTQVVTDALVLRRCNPADERSSAHAADWETTVAIGGDEQRAVSINRKFAQDHPERVIIVTGTR